MRTLAYAMVALVTLSGVAMATTDDSDHYGDTPYCNTTQRDALSERTSGNNPAVRACEGEHWEGGDYNAASDGDFYGDCDAVKASGSRVLVSRAYCPGSGLTTMPTGVGDVGVRVSANGANVYQGVQIGGVGRSAVWADGRHVVWYGHDGTNQLGVTCAAWADEDCNALASIIHDAGITRGSAVAEEDPDCSQNANGDAVGPDTYEDGTCARDNTSIGVLLLP